MIRSTRLRGYIGLLEYLTAGGGLIGIGWHEQNAAAVVAGAALLVVTGFVSGRHQVAPTAPLTRIPAVRQP